MLNGPNRKINNLLGPFNQRGFMATQNITNSASACYFYVNVLNTVSDVTGAGSEYTLIWDHAIYDNLSAVSLVNGIFTVPITGLYMLRAECIMGSITAAMTDGYFEIVNSTTGISHGKDYRNPYAVRSTINPVECMWFQETALMLCTAGDSIITRVKISNGAGDTADWIEGSCFSGFLVYRT